MVKLFLVLVLPILALAQTYDDSLARNKMMPLSGAAYSDNPQACLTVVNGGKLKRQVTVQCDYFKSDTCSGYTAVSDSDRAIIVSFRGTTTFFQLLSEVDNSAFAEKVSFTGGGSVSKYFATGFNDVWTGGMKDDFLSLASQYPSYDLWVTGHSLGGAMAALCAQTIASTKLFPANKIFLTTFGEPRNGDKDYAHAHDSLVPNSLRVTHKRDIVPHVPPENFEGYYHHKVEVWYNNDMSSASYKMCSGDEDDSCSGSILDFSVDDHLHYFGKSVDGFGKAGCK